MVSGLVDLLQSADVRFASTVGLVVWITLLAWLLTESYVAAHQAVPADLRRFGDRFVQAFSRPLMHGRTDEPPIRARLRCADGLEILIAPNRGRTYPNLADHKRNTEYDVDRVLRLLADQRFVSGRLRAEGPWVVIPIRRRVEGKDAGVT